MKAGRPILGKALGELSLLGIRPSEVTFVGDEAVTVTDAQAVEADFVVVSNGTVSAERLLEQGVPAGRLIPDLYHLPGLLGISV